MFLKTYGASNVVDPIKRVKGVSSVSEYGPEYSMRVELKPDLMAQLGLTASDVAAAIQRAQNGQILKLKDIADIYEGERMDTPASLFLDKGVGGESVVYPISLTSDANAIETVAEIRKVLEDAETRFPPDMKLIVAQDKTQFVRESLEKVAHTFFEALVLVLIVVYIFLGNFRATLVPMLAVPVSLIGTFHVCHDLGYRSGSG